MKLPKDDIIHLLRIPEKALIKVQDIISQKYAEDYYLFTTIDRRRIVNLLDSILDIDTRFFRIKQLIKENDNKQNDK